MAEASRIDWQAIKARWNSETAEFHLAILPKGAAQLFLAICDRLHWKATYRVEGYDFADWDELQRIVDLGIGGLTDTVRLADLLAHVDDVETILRQIRDGQCCSVATTVISDDEWNIAISGYDEGIPEATHDTSDPPPDYATDATGETPFSAAAFVEDYLCAQAHLLWNVLDDLLEYGSSFAGWANSLANWTNQLGYTILRYLYTNVPALEPVLFSLAELAALNDAMAAEITTTSWQEARAEWFAAKVDVICALAGQPNATDWRSAMQAIIASTVTDNLIAAILFGGIPAAVYSLIFEGLMKPDTWAGETCAGCGVGDLYGEWYFDTTAEGWIGGEYDPNAGYPDAGTYYHGQYAQSNSVGPIPETGTVTVKCYMRNKNTGSQGTAHVTLIDVNGTALGTSGTQPLTATWSEYTFSFSYTGGDPSPGINHGIRIYMSGASLVDVDSVRVWIAA